MLTDNLGIVIVDMQPGFLDDLDAKIATGLMERMLRVIDLSVKKGLPIIYFETCVESCERTYPELMPTQGEFRVFQKYQLDGFSFRNYYENGTPNVWLRERKVSKVLVTGLYGPSCVLQTSLGAKALNFEVILSRDLTESFSKENPEIKFSRVKTIPYNELVEALA